MPIKVLEEENKWEFIWMARINYSIPNGLNIRYRYGTALKAWIMVDI